MRTVVVIAAVVGAVLAAVAAIGGLTGAGGGPALPEAAGGLVRLVPDDTVREADARMAGTGGTARYGPPGSDRAQVLLVLAADTRSGAASDKLDRFYSGLTGSGAVADRARALREDPGPGGGLLECVPADYPDRRMSLGMCVWADARAVGSVLALPDGGEVRTVAELAALTREIREAADSAGR